MEPFERQIARINDLLAQVAQNEDLFKANLAALIEENRKLRETVNRYIRYRGDGREQN